MLLARRWLAPTSTARPWNRDTPWPISREITGSTSASDACACCPARSWPIRHWTPCGRSEYSINVIAVERHERLRNLLLIATGNTELFVGDVLLVDLASPAIGLLGAYRELGLEPLQLSTSYYADHARELGLAEVALPPDSRLPGKTIQQLGFRSRHKLNVVGLRRIERRCRVCWWTKLKPADTLLVAGSWKHPPPAGSEPRLPGAKPAGGGGRRGARAGQAPFALLGLALMVALMVSGLVPNVLAALIGCLVMGLFRCIDMDSAYKAIHWQSLVLIVGMLPFALALQKTGGIALATSGLVGLLGDAGPHALLACLFLLTALIGLFISNTATAVLMAPVALATAEQLGASPYPFAMIVALAASAAFMTPISSPVNTLVLGGAVPFRRLRAHRRALHRAGDDRRGAAGTAGVSALRRHHAGRRDAQCGMAGKRHSR